jgi:hypothetical protein
MPVKSLNRGVQDLGYTRLSKSPKWYFGGDFGFPASGFPSLSPALAVERAKYEGILAIQGLGELPTEVESRSRRSQLSHRKRRKSLPPARSQSIWD